MKTRKPRPSDGNKTSVAVTPEDRAVFARLGVTPSAILKAWATRYRDASPKGSGGSVPDRYDTDGMTPDEIDDLIHSRPVELPAGLKPTKPHGWETLPSRTIARAATLDEAVRLRDEMRERGGDARLAAPYVLLVAAVSPMEVTP